ncbi:cytochrome c [Rhodoferax sp.]|uniref:cytochrome c n=1 Tax=Rhodoferax sp. TaxID=50421 RepID=UPI00272EFA32|nr:c-type cytochrome [Rhodoferax sp.]MDP1530693.1 c-type cytochrome [Rhodoferax sp.]MDP1944755.1 c-type cytochrome [Rhodoferax sp.]MDP2443617.1 c-type cytochrome [Rhodoferax sp.]MDZ4208355.1 c-type cytochrome [Rhodoferax sp.]
MVQSTLTTLVALLAIFAAPLACASDSASVVRGGRLYDNWSLEAKGRAPNHPNPAFKSKQAPIAPADSWRCVTCHGWDYQGAEGIKGISSREKTDPLVIAALLKDANHGYGELLSELDRLDLGNFVASGQTDMRKLQALALRSKPGQATSDKVYATVCANCHGLDGALLRQVPPLGDSARQRPQEVLHVALNGHPGGNMPALRTLGEETVAKMLAYLQTLPSINLAASIANGGRLYDDWQVHTGGQRQALPHPAYPPTAYYANAASETWRCKECHGWDYKGHQGQYARGKHATGIKGVRTLVGVEPDKIIATLNSRSHLYGAVLKHRDLQDLANFVSYGQIDMDALIDGRTGLSRGDAARGAAHYRTMCAGCHGLEGAFVAKRHVGRVTREDPWHSLHNMLNGHPDDTMPALREIDPKVISDILAHMQTLQERR